MLRHGAHAGNRHIQPRYQHKPSVVINRGRPGRAPGAKVLEFREIKFLPPERPRAEPASPAAAVSRGQDSADAARRSTPPFRTFHCDPERRHAPPSTPASQRRRGDASSGNAEQAPAVPTATGGSQVNGGSQVWATDALARGGDIGEATRCSATTEPTPPSTQPTAGGSGGSSPREK